MDAQTPSDEPPAPAAEPDPDPGPAEAELEPDTDEPAAPNRIEVRATINLPGFPAGAVATVDPGDPWIAELLTATYLVEIPKSADAGATISPDEE